MYKVDEAIEVANKNICDNINKLKDADVGLLAQNILNSIRNLVEYIAIKEFSNGKDINPQDERVNKAALSFIRDKGHLKFLYSFHDLIQKSVSHYSFIKEDSERLMLKYLGYLLKIRKYVKDRFGIKILENIEEIPLNNDSDLAEYYEKISQRIKNPSRISKEVVFNDRYYIQKIKPFFVQDEIYYEISFTTVESKNSKFNRIIAFTKLDILENYAVKFRIHEDVITILNRNVPVLIVDDYQVSIRECEFENFARIFGVSINSFNKTNEYKLLMKFLMNTKETFSSFITEDQKHYNDVKDYIASNSKSISFLPIFDVCRDIVLKKKKGANVILYLLYHLNNKTIKLQSGKTQCINLSNLYLKNSCIPFDKMPFCTSLYQHNPKIYDLIDCIPTENRKCEFMARYIKNNAENNGSLFTNKVELKDFENIDQLRQEYNDKLYITHQNRRIEKFKEYYFLEEYEDDCKQIIQKLIELSKHPISQYSASVERWLSSSTYAIDDDYKREIMKNMFSKSSVAMIYGSAGTGKTTLINHVSNFWSNNTKVFLTNTHPALDNLKRRTNASKSEFYTVAKFLTDGNINPEFDILIIDECSTVSNRDMRGILHKAKFKLLVLVGDNFQIESIRFGNWFSIARKFIPNTSVFNLKIPYRTKCEELILLWNRVRELDPAILETLVKNKFVSKLDDSIFTKNNDDEIILCLNYDGLYGINNINRILQNNNKSEPVTWGINTYKVGDPVLFNEVNAFSPLIHNNSKGKIVKIKKDEDKITFDIEVEASINSIIAEPYNFDLIGESNSGNSIISFSVNKVKNSDEDDDEINSTVVPFQVAYAVSIHKAQGLEYESVKIVITEEAGENITHNIFYTAITRAKKYLKIFWSPVTEEKVINNFKKKDNNKNAYILAQIESLSITNEIDE